MRIITVLPSATEIVIALGAREEIVGVCHCDNYGLDVPVITDKVVGKDGWKGSAALDAEVRSVAASGKQMYSVDDNELARLAPNVVITQDLCDVCAVSADTVRQACRGMEVDIVPLAPSSLQDVIGDIRTVAAAIGRDAAATALVASLASRMETLLQLPLPTPRPRVAVVEWTAPVFIGGHWVPQMVRIAGGDAVINTPLAGGTPPAGEYPSWGTGGAKSIGVEDATLLEADPDLVVVVPCGLTLDLACSEVREAPWPTSLRAWREGRFYVVDGSEHFARPGPALVEATEWLASVIRGVGSTADVPPPPQGFPARQLGSG